MEYTEGIYHLFGGNKKAKLDFYNWCKDNEELCPYDLELLENDLFLPALDSTQKYVYLNKGNLLDWLESKGYYIELRVNNKKFHSVVKYNEDKISYTYTSEYMKRVPAIEASIKKSIEHYEKNI